MRAYPDKGVVQLFAKAPRLGRVKTRLARQLGDPHALAIYRALLQQAAQTLRRAPWALQLWSDAPEHPEIQQLAQQLGARCYRQCEGDIGHRMLHALRIGRRQYSRVLLMGADCPLLQLQHLEQADRALAARRGVLLPVEDGGYCLIGAARVHHRWFCRMRWSHADVTRTSVQRARAIGGLGLLAPLWDIDEPADWQRLQRQAPRRLGGLFAAAANHHVS